MAYSFHVNYELFLFLFRASILACSISPFSIEANFSAFIYAILFSLLESYSLFISGASSTIGSLLINVFLSAFVSELQKNTVNFSNGDIVSI